MGKPIDLSMYSGSLTDSTLRNIFLNDRDLRLVFALINNYEPTTIPQICDRFAELFGRIQARTWFYDKLNKIEHFGLFAKMQYCDCSNNGKLIEIEIIKKHIGYLSNQPKQFHSTLKNSVYYYLTEKGSKWVLEIDKINQKGF